jgi:transcriptional regulator with XRE-family HTH domain
MTFADQLRKERQRLRLTQAEAADLLEVSFEVVSKWERELTEPAKITQEGALLRLKNACRST